MTKQQAFLVDRNEILRKELLEREQSRGSLSRRRSGPRSGTKQAHTKLYNCETCGLYKSCCSPKLGYYGKGKKGIMFIGIAPGREEDRAGVPFIGPSGRLLRKTLTYFDIDIDEDCYRTNIIQCMLPKNRTPSREEVLCCRTRIFSEIVELKPKLVICLGDKPSEVILGPLRLKSTKLRTIHGLAFPYQEHNCWVGATYHPAAILRDGSKNYILSKEHIFSFDLCDIISHKDKPLPVLLDRKGCYLLRDSNECIAKLDEIIIQRLPTSFDYETTSISPYEKDAKILTVSLSNDIEKSYCIPLGMSDWSEIENAFVWNKFKEFLKSDVPKIVQNFNMEELWSRLFFNLGMRGFYRDTLSAHHVIYCRRGTASLDFQVKLLTGDLYKKTSVNTAALESESLEAISEYNGLDSRYTLMASYKQEQMLTGELRSFDTLLKRSLITLANMKERGINVDTELLNKLSTICTAKLSECELIINRCNVVKAFEEKENKKFNMRSGPQKAKVLFDYFGLSSKKKTKGGKCSTDEETLIALANESKNKEAVEFINQLQEYNSYESFVKRIVSYGKFIFEDGRIHPSFHLDVAETYRSSSSDPNVHNIPKHDNLLNQLRKCIIPSKGRVLLEADFAGTEVKVIAMYSGDPVLTKQIQDGIDTHTLWASRMFEVDYSKVTKKQRFYSKNKFVFPSFYGAQPLSIAMSLGKDIHFITSLQERFWSEYVEVKQWQKNVLIKYQRTGYVEGLSGFRRPGPLSLEQILNTPVQGLAFHLLLDALERIDSEFVMRKYKTEIVNQVHDSILFDTTEDEVEKVMEKATSIMTAKRFEWQKDVPLTVSWEIGSNWLEMEKI